MIGTGTRLAGRYEVLAPLGAGGMGEVYRARDLRLHREVAVKVLPQRLAHDRDTLARFEREARALAALSHPNILAIHDFGSDSGVAFAVMELLTGETLRERLKRSPLAWQKTLELGVQVAEGLGAAHGKGIVHRDLKPENIFLTSAGDLKILDFGLARLGEPASATPPGADLATAETDPGVVMGTVPYMSPEQLRGGPADARSDIFSLGCVLHETVTGRAPFARQSLADTMAAVLNEEPPEPVAADAGVPPALQQAVLRALEKEPSARFQSAQDMAFALRMISGASGILPTLPFPRRRRWRMRSVVGASAGLAVLLALALALARWGRGSGIRSIAVLPFASAGSDPDVEYLGDGIAETVNHSLSQIPQLRVMARSTVFRFKGASADPQRVGRELKVDAVLTGQVSQRSGRVVIEAELVDVATGSLLWGDRYDGPFADLPAMQQQIASRISEKLRLRLSGDQQERMRRRPTVDAEAYRLYLKGRYHSNKRTAEGLRRGIELLDEAIERDPSYGLAYAGLADSYALVAAYSVAPPGESMPKARAAAEKALEMDDTLAEAHACLALVKLLYDWDWPEAERRFRRAIELNPGYATAHHWYAEYLIAMGRTPEALAALARAEELDPLSTIIVTDRGRAFYFARQYERAIAEMRKALEADRGFVPARLSLGMALEELSRHDEAIAEYEEVARLTGNPRSRTLTARALALAGRRDEAEARLRELLELSRTSYVSPYAIALVHAGLGDKDRAFEWLGRAVDERSAWMTYLRVNPRLDSLRDDPRFAALLERVVPAR